MITHPVEQLAAVGAVDPDPPQFLAPAAHPLELHPRAFGFGERSGGHHHCQEQAHGVDQQMTLAALDHLAAIVTTLAPHRSGLDALAVQTASRGMLMPTG